MKANTHIATSIGKFGAAILLGTLAVTTVACSSKSKPAVNSSSSMPASASLHPAVLQTGVPVVEQPAPVAVSKKTSAKPSASKSIVYRSRDYGVSFDYPWQYSFVSAKAVANGDESLRPKSDGHEGQFTLARVEIPKGFYSDTDYESGYFILSLNQDLNQQECESALNPGNDAKPESDTINGVEFRWVETDSGGRGQAAKLRQYVTFSNGTCYELELGVKTSNEGGLAREVNPDQVLRRLDGILRTVKIQPSTEKPAAAVAESPKAEPAPATEN
ncbi:MAG TPA: hypothetical protein VF840_09895 [Terriglobales bacterium]